MTQELGRGCQQCGQPLTGRGPQAKYCSANCRAKAGYLRAREDGRYRQWLQTQAAKAEAERQANARPCPYCGDPMANPRRVQCGKPDCERLATNERARKRSRQHKAETGQWPHRRYADQQRAYKRRIYAERRANGEPTERQLYPEAFANKDARRRARKAQADIEVFSRREIFERDQWTCGVCHQPVDETLQWPDPMSASLDHIVPLSQHGGHTRANCRLAHVQCNVSRGDRGGGEQLRLIG